MLLRVISVAGEVDVVIPMPLAGELTARVDEVRSNHRIGVG